MMGHLVAEAAACGVIVSGEFVDTEPSHPDGVLLVESAEGRIRLSTHPTAAAAGFAWFEAPDRDEWTPNREVIDLPTGVPIVPNIP